MKKTFFVTATIALVLTGKLYSMADEQREQLDQYYLERKNLEKKQAPEWSALNNKYKDVLNARDAAAEAERQHFEQSDRENKARAERRLYKWTGAGVVLGASLGFAYGKQNVKLETAVVSAVGLGLIAATSAFVRGLVTGEIN